MLITEYINKALEMATYSQDENGVIIAEVKELKGFFSQGDTFEEARENLKDAIEGNIIIALKMGFKIPKIATITFDTSKKILSYA
jgi:predicted RNase H-like HicB family nuclease